MFAIYAVPGSAFHQYKHFPASRQEVAEARKKALRWLDDVEADHLIRNPALGAQPSRILSDSVALRQKYLSGSPIYTRDED